MKTTPKYTITLFHCINAFAETEDPDLSGKVELTPIQMACSSMTRDIFLLKAFEAGADAVVVLVCPDGACRYAEGNLRARKRVARVQDTLDEIGLGRRRLSIHAAASKETAGLKNILEEILADLRKLGPNPAAKAALMN